MSVATATADHGDGPTFSVDARPGGGIDQSRTVRVGESFNVEVVVTDAGATPPWWAYQVTLEYDDLVLDGVVAAPDVSWAASPVAGVHGGNVYPFSDGPYCDPAFQGEELEFEDDSGVASWAMTCANAGPLGAFESGGGALVEFALRCERPGTAVVSTTGAADTFLYVYPEGEYNDHEHDATIRCVGRREAGRDRGHGCEHANSLAALIRCLFLR
jgi:hypothetical protein